MVFPSLVNALQRIGEGETAIGALCNACGHSEDEINSEFKTYLEEHLKPFEHLPELHQDQSLIDKIVETVSGKEPDVELWFQKESPFTDALRKGTRALKEEKWEEAEQALKKAHDLFPDYTAENAPLRQLITLYENWGKRNELKQTLLREIEWNPTDFDACQKLIPLLVEDKDWKEVVRVAHWALGIDPFDIGIRRTLF